MTNSGRRVLDQAYDELEEEVPEPVARVSRWLRAPERRWLRIAVAVLFLVGGCLWFLPVLGIELLPIGLLFLSEDVPFMRKPAGRAILWAVHKWRALKDWSQSRKRRRANSVGKA